MKPTLFLPARHCLKTQSLAGGDALVERMKSQLLGFSSGLASAKISVVELVETENRVSGVTPLVQV